MSKLQMHIEIYPTDIDRTAWLNYTNPEQKELQEVLAVSISVLGCL